MLPTTRRKRARRRAEETMTAGTVRGDFGAARRKWTDSGLDREQNEPVNNELKSLRGSDKKKENVCP